MILSIMTYVLLTTCLLGAAAISAERLCAQLGRPRRGVWMAALVASVALPAYSILADRDAPDATPVSARAATEAAYEVRPSEPDDGAGGVGEMLVRTLPDWRLWLDLVDWHGTAGRHGWSALDTTLAAIWIGSAAATLLFYGFAWFALYRAIGRCPTFRADHGNDVSISARLGPAMFGLVNPRIVIPRWLLDAPPAMRAIVLRHELEHIAGKDQLLLFAGLVLTALAPWNPGLWWQLRRLRLATEVDCDARVVQSGADALAYSKALLAVRERRFITPLAGIALTEPVSQLERRIRLLLQGPPQKSRLLASFGALFSTALLVAACAVDPPDSDMPRTSAEIETAPRVHREPLTQWRLPGERVAILVDVSETMLDRTVDGAERRRDLPAEQQRQAPKWRQLLATVDWLAGQIKTGSQFQVIAFNDGAYSLVQDTDGVWLTKTDDGFLEQVMQTLRNETRPQGRSNLHAAFAAASALQPPPDDIYLVIDGLPTAGPGDEPPRSADDQPPSDDEQQIDYYRRALDVLPADAAVSVILLPLEGVSLAAPAYWTLALQTGGSLLAPAEDASGGTIGGMPLDSEYLAFVLDTSGSMRMYAWDRVRQQIRETLEVYPNVKGMQFMSDEGEYLLKNYGEEWISALPERREEVLEALRESSVFVFSNSSPHEGILAAIDAFSDTEKRVSIYVYSDDFARGSLDEVVRDVDQRNRAQDRERRHVRIHAVAFPVYYEVTGGEQLSAARYATLMREITQRNGGSFIALPAD